MGEVRPLQIFNRYLERGGEEEWVRTLESDIGLPTCWLQSADWVEAGAPAKWTQPLRMLWNPPAVRRVRAAHREADAGVWVVHNVFPVGSAAIYREAGRLRVPLVQYVHNFRPFSVSGYLIDSDLPGIARWRHTYLKEIRRASWQQSRLRTACFAGVLTSARAAGWFGAIDAWIAVSDFMRDQFIRAGVAAESIFTLRHFWRAAPEDHAPEDHGFYLFMGRLAEMKGVLVLLAVWDRLLAERGAGAPTLIIAGDGPLETVVRARGEKNSLIKFVARVSGDEKRRLLRGATAIVAPSICLESLGLVVYEAYDAAKPVLAARAGGLAELVRHGVTGYVHKPGDVAALAEHVALLEARRHEARAMGRNGREWLLASTSEEEWRARFKRILEFAVSRHG